MLKIQIGDCVYNPPASNKDLLILIIYRKNLNINLIRNYRKIAFLKGNSISKLFCGTEVLRY